MTHSRFTSLGRDFKSTLEHPAWLEPFGVIAGDRLADGLLACISSGWTTLDRDWLHDVRVRVEVSRSATELTLHIHEIQE